MRSFLFMWAAWAFAMLSTNYDVGWQVWLSGLWTGGVLLLTLLWLEEITRPHDKKSK